MSQKRVTYGEFSEQLRDLGFTEDNGGRWYFSFKDDSGNTLHTVEVHLQRESENGSVPAYLPDHVITVARIGIVGDTYGFITINKDGTLSPSLGLFFVSDGKTLTTMLGDPKAEEPYKRESERLAPVFTSVLEKFNNAINVSNSALYGGSYDELTSIIRNNFVAIYNNDVTVDEEDSLIKKHSANQSPWGSITCAGGGTNGDWKIYVEF
jgi:hypothetical protein